MQHVEKRVKIHETAQQHLEVLEKQSTAQLGSRLKEKIGNMASSSSQAAIEYAGKPVSLGAQHLSDAANLALTAGRAAGSAAHSGGKAVGGAAQFALTAAHSGSKVAASAALEALQAGASTTGKALSITGNTLALGAQTVNLGAQVGKHVLSEAAIAARPHVKKAGEALVAAAEASAPVVRKAAVIGGHALVDVLNAGRERSGDLLNGLMRGGDVAFQIADDKIRQGRDMVSEALYNHQLRMYQQALERDRQSREEKLMIGFGDGPWAPAKSRAASPPRAAPEPPTAPTKTKRKNQNSGVTKDWETSKEYWGRQTLAYLKTQLELDGVRFEPGVFTGYKMIDDPLRENKKNREKVKRITKEELLSNLYASRSI